MHKEIGSLKFKTMGVLSLAHMINDIYANFLPQLVAVLIAAGSLSVS